MLSYDTWLKKGNNKNDNDFVMDMAARAAELCRDKMRWPEFTWKEKQIRNSEKIQEIKCYYY